MDWYSWLSKTNLESTLVYEYGLAFVRNELQEEDLAYFNHEFLQSLGISVAKHRLEILKLARKESKQGSRIKGLSRLVNRTRKLISRNFSKLSSPIFPSNTAPNRSPYRSHFAGALRRMNTAAAKPNQHEQKAVVISNRNVMWSGPLEKRVQQQSYMMTSSLSGPLDGKMMYPDWSPMVSRPTEMSGFVPRSPIDRLGLSPQVTSYSRGNFVDADGIQSLWSLMFQDMKPT